MRSSIRLDRVQSLLRVAVGISLLTLPQLAWSGPPQTIQLTLQEGLNGYAGTRDTTILDNLLPPSTRDNSQGGHPYIYAGASGRGPRRALLTFDLNPIPYGATITSVTLELTLVQAGPSSSEFDRYTLHRLTKDWGEGIVDGSISTGGPANPGDATYNSNFHTISLWDVLGGDFVTSPSAATLMPNIPPSVGTFSAPQMVADVQDWINTPMSNFGWILIGEEGGTNTARRFDARESPVAVNRPRLHVTYLPGANVQFSEWFFY